MAGDETQPLNGTSDAPRPMGMLVAAAAAAGLVFGGAGFGAGLMMGRPHAARLTMSNGVLTEVAADGRTACKIPEGWCNGTDMRKDALSYRDCDGDGVLDPYCEGGQLLRFGYISSANDCKDNWPTGLCKVARHAGEGAVSNEHHAASNEITIVHFNDVYNIAGTMEDGVRFGGMSRAVHMVKKLRKRNPDRTFVVFAGDCLSPSVLSDMFKGEQMIDVLNDMKLDAASLGNHEFDFGVELLDTRLQESTFPWLNTNLMDETGQLLKHTTEYLIKSVEWAPRWEPDQKQEIKVCFFGVAYDVRETMFKDVDRLTFENVLNASRRSVDYLKNKEGCKVILPLTHQFSEQDCELAKELGDDIDLILGGHDHATEFTSVCGKAPYVKAASDLKTQWVMTLWLDDDGKVESVDGQEFSLTDADPHDEEIHEKIVMWEEKAEKELAKLVGCLGADLDAVAFNVRRGETTMGNFGADAVRAMHKTDVALINGGTLRGNKVYSAGKASRKDLLEIHPFGNQVAKIYATGKELFDYINMNLDGWDTASGDFVQVSGLRYEFDHTKPAGERLQKLMTEDKKEVDPEQKFTVAITDYMLSNSPLRHNELYQMTTLNDAVPLFQAFVEAVSNAGDACYTAELDGRIKDVAA
ncbi:unnamed protein product [Prorocentrum cordatum]|uniref:5'-nucleotidase n=1 Tax=Prorocentrum cordatum TaxID=2364126 RepID=A0ABN9QL19_9DINO|nr:unnamed protein product [Polarella glacialis]|mmetsp:Transcript_26485/g.75576  ORF Transcript_26485/g.75576 Transcript_26485/m.75576 type:complete len:640 (-) Transcript_26485:156-2075(-)